MEEALLLLTLSDACSADRVFVCQVRLQLLKQRADDVRRQDEVCASAPGLLYLKTLQRELNELRSCFPVDLSEIGKCNC